MPCKLNQYLNSELTEKLGNCTHGIFVDYTGVTAMEANTLRGRLLKDALRLTIVKNRVAKIVLKDATRTDVASLLKGPIAVIYGNSDPVVAAKVALSCIQDSGKLQLRGGFLEGKPLAPEQVKELARMASKSEILAQILGSITAPASTILGCLEGVLREINFNALASELSGLFEAYRQKVKGSAG
jgi:large subunit ribosomal protein L10